MLVRFARFCFIAGMLFYQRALWREGLTDDQAWSVIATSWAVVRKTLDGQKADTDAR